MRSHRRWSLLGLILFVGAGWSCTTDSFGPTELPAQFEITGSINTVAPSLLACSPQRYQINSMVVGPKGGKIKVGSHVLTIPANALSRDVTIVAEQLTGDVNSVRFGPEGLTFARPAELTLSYTNCSAVADPKQVVYTDENLKVLETLRSADKPQTKTVSSPIEHFSRYAVAY